MNAESGNRGSERNADAGKDPTTPQETESALDSPIFPRAQGDSELAHVTIDRSSLSYPISIAVISEATDNSKIIYPEAASLPVETSSFLNLASRFLHRIGELASPSYHIEQFKLDYAAYRESQRSSFDQVSRDVDRLATSFKGKLFSSLVLSNIIGYTTGALVSAIYQGIYADPMSATMVNLVSSYAASLLSFQGLWARSNFSLYREKYSSLLDRGIEFERDLWPCHKKAFTASLQCYLISVPVSLGIGLVIASFGETAARVVPAGLLSFIFTTPLDEGLFIRLLGDFHKGYCQELAQKYLSSPAKQAEQSSQAGSAVSV